jgi:hypothetical protein
MVIQHSPPTKCLKFRSSSLLFIFLIVLGTVPAFAQLGIGTTNPAASAALEVSSPGNNKGILIPRLSAAQKDAIVNPAEGLLIYQTTAPVGFYYYVGTSWKWIANATDLSSVGNAATATKLATPRNINGVAFDGSADITVPAVTSISALTLGTSGTDLSSTVANGSTTPVITLNIPTASATNRGALSSADWTTFNGKQNTITLTTTGTSGAATFASNTINIPNYGSTFSGYVPYKGATDSVNLGAFDLTVNSLSVGRGGGGIASNTAIGNGALFANTTGANSTAIGNFALSKNVSAIQNTAIGSLALFENLVGTSNTATGFQALRNNTGSGNTANGASALGENLAGNNNTGIGFGALRKNTTASANTAIGHNALFANIDGFNNTAIGALALGSNTSGTLNTATGVSALTANTTGTSNTATGLFALGANTTGTTNTAMGQGALRFNTVGSYNTAVGYNALNPTNPAVALTGGNTALGYNAGSANTTGTNNTFVGNAATASSATLTNATAIGNGASVSADNTIQLGNTSVINLRVGNNLTVGRGSGGISSNTAIGFNTLNANTLGIDNTAIGSSALAANISGGGNTASGKDALRLNTIGVSNNAFGLGALYFNTQGNNNIAIGNSSIFTNVLGSKNTAMGIDALKLTNPAIANTGDNTAIGYQAGLTNTTGLNNTFIGSGAVGSSATANNEITLGNSSIATIRAQVTAITSLSDRRDKTDIATISEGLDFIKQLKPVSFTWNTRDKAKVGIKSAGFIAQDLLALQQKSAIGANLDLVSQENPNKLEARYSNLLPVIIKAIQEESAQKDAEIAALKAQFQAQQKQIEELKLLILSLKK